MIPAYRYQDMMKTHLAICLFAALSLTACKSGQDEPDPNPSPIDYREEVPSGAYVESSDELTFFLDTLASGFNSPWGMTFISDTEVLVTEKSGKLFLVDAQQNTRKEISGLPAIQAIGQGGLLDIITHPNYKSNGWIYLAYATTTTGGYGTAVSRAKLQNDQLVDLEEVFKTDPGAGGGAHFGCRLVIHDGYLFISLGERYAMQRAQDKGDHLGTIIRVHDDGRVPSDNPFVNEPNAKPEIWSYGHRNPQGLIWNPFRNELWSHEHGPRGGDEINIIEKGGNYGWPLASFGIDYDGDTITSDTAVAGTIQPIHYWVPSIAPCGMTILTSDVYPEWKGNVFIGALAGMALHRIELTGKTVVRDESLLSGLQRVRNVIQGSDGYLYVALESPGIIYRVVPAKE